MNKPKGAVPHRGNTELHSRAIEGRLVTNLPSVVMFNKASVIKAKAKTEARRREAKAKDLSLGAKASKFEAVLRSLQDTMKYSLLISSRLALASPTTFL